MPQGYFVVQLNENGSKKRFFFFKNFLSWKVLVFAGGRLTRCRQASNVWRHLSMHLICNPMFPTNVLNLQKKTRSMVD